MVAGSPSVHGTGLQLPAVAARSPCVGPEALSSRCACPAGLPTILATFWPLLLPPISTHPPPQVGDWLLFPAMGAYTLCGASKFNGIDATAPSTFYIASRH